MHEPSRREHPVKATRATSVPEPELPVGLAVRLFELSRDGVTGDGDVTVRALALATALIPGTLAASLTHIRSGGTRPRTLAASAPAADVVDQAQYDTGQGPCLTAVCETVVTVTDFTTETRWPLFTARAMDTSPLRAAASYPLAAGGHPGVTLNLYSEDPDAYAGPGLKHAALAAADVALVLTAVILHRRGESAGRAGIQPRHRRRDGHPHAHPPHHRRAGVRPVTNGQPDREPQVARPSRRRPAHRGTTHPSRAPDRAGALQSPPRPAWPDRRRHGGVRPVMTTLTRRRSWDAQAAAGPSRARPGPAG